MLVQLNLPHQEWERMLGFSIPRDDELIVATYDGISQLHLGTPLAASLDERYPEGRGVFDPASGEVSYEGLTFQMIGIHGGTPILDSPWGERIVLGVEEDMETPDGSRLRATPKERTLQIRASDGEIVLSFTFCDFSRDWHRAPFSRDGRYVAVAMPDDLHAFRRAPGSAPELSVAAH
jgi:hypothetical protein